MDQNMMGEQGNRWMNKMKKMNKMMGNETKDRGKRGRMILIGQRQYEVNKQKQMNEYDERDG